MTVVSSEIRRPKVKKSYKWGLIKSLPVLVTNLSMCLVNISLLSTITLTHTFNSIKLLYLLVIDLIVIDRVGHVRTI